MHTFKFIFKIIIFQRWKIILFFDPFFSTLVNQGYYIQVGLRMTSRLAGLRFAIQKGSVKQNPLEIITLNLEMI